MEQKLEDLNKQLQGSLNLLQPCIKEKVNGPYPLYIDNGQSSELAYSDMTDNSMRQLLRQLEKEKNQVEWQLKECEWRLDQEAAVSEIREITRRVQTQYFHFAGLS